MLFAAWLWLASPPSLPPEPPASSVVVSWRAPADCPSEEDFVRRVEELRSGARLSSSFAFVVEGRGPFELQVVGQELRYTAARCDALVDAALLLVSLALIDEVERTDPEPVEAQPVEARIEEEIREPSEPDRRREADDVAPFLRGPERPPNEPGRGVVTRARLRVESGVAAVVTPTPSFELFVGAGPRGRVWAVDLGLLTRPAFGGASPEADVGARLSTWGGLARVCVGGRARSVSLAACGGVEVALISARPTGTVDDARVGRRPWVALELGPDLAVPVARRVGLVVRVSGTYLAAQPNFTIADAGLVCCRSSLGISARIGVEIGLGR